LDMETGLTGSIDADAALINEMHETLSGLARTSLEKAIEIGEALSVVKKRVGHGNWMAWCEGNLTFEKSSVAKYLGLHRHRAKIHRVEIWE